MIDGHLSKNNFPFKLFIRGVCASHFHLSTAPRTLEHYKVILVTRVCTVYKQISCQENTRLNLIPFYSLLRQTIEALKKRNKTVKSDKHTKRKGRN